MKFLNTLSRHKQLVLGLILLFSLGVRLFRLWVPDTYYFDEVYHAVTAKAYARNDPAGYEWWHSAPEPHTAYEWLHPPIAKLLMAGSIVLLGPHPFAWRLPGALFGVLLIYLIYRVGKSLFDDETVGLVAALIASLDGLVLAQSRIGMNDIYVSVFMTGSLYLYWLSIRYGKRKLVERWPYLFGAALTAGLAVSTKWSGVFVLGVVGLMELIYLIWQKGETWRSFLVTAVSFILIPAAVYVLSFTQFWLQGHTLNQFRELHNQIWYYQTHLDATHSYQSKAWQWPLNLKPVWYWVDYQDEAVSNIYNLMNPAVAWFGVAAMVWGLVWVLVESRKRWLPWLLVAVAYMFSWTPWLLSPRIMFSYHYLPAVPWLVIGLAWVLVRLKRGGRAGWLVSGGVLLLIMACFIFFLPLWTGLPVPKDRVDDFFWLQSWK